MMIVQIITQVINFFPPVTAGEAAANKALVKKEKQLRFLIRKACKVITNLFSSLFLCFIVFLFYARKAYKDIAIFSSSPSCPPSLALRRPPGSGFPELMIFIAI